MLLSKKLLFQGKPLYFIDLQRDGTYQTIDILGVSDSVISYVDSSGVGTANTPSPVRMIRGWKGNNKDYARVASVPTGSNYYVSLNENLTDDTDWCFVSGRFPSGTRTLYASTYKINKKTGESTTVNNATFTSTASANLSNAKVAQLGDGRYYVVYAWLRATALYYSVGASGSLQQNVLNTASSSSGLMSTMSTTPDGKVVYVPTAPGSTAQCAIHVVQNGSVNIGGTFAGGTAFSGFGIVGDKWYVISNATSLTAGEGGTVKNTITLTGTNRLIGVNSEVITVARLYSDDYKKITLQFYKPDLTLIGTKDVTVPDECVPSGSQGFYQTANARVSVNSGRYAYLTAGTGWCMIVDTKMLSDIL